MTNSHPFHKKMKTVNHGFHERLQSKQTQIQLLMNQHKIME